VRGGSAREQALALALLEERAATMNPNDPNVSLLERPAEQLGEALL